MISLREITKVADHCFVIEHQHPIDGDKAFLLGQGYMPAQQFHILKNPADENAPWYYVSKISYPFETAGVTFKKGTLMRPDY